MLTRKNYEKPYYEWQQDTKTLCSDVSFLQIKHYLPPKKIKTIENIAIYERNTTFQGMPTRAEAIWTSRA